MVLTPQRLTQFPPKVTYVSSRVAFGFFGFIWFKCQIIKRCLADYENGDVWWSCIGVACLVMPSIPIAFRFFWQKIREFQSRREADRVKCFIKLVLISSSYICGGFILFALYRVIYQLSCTWRNITGTIFQVNEKKYRKKELQMN